MPGYGGEAQGNDTRLRRRAAASSIWEISVDCIRDDREPEVTAEHARHVIETMEKGYLAAPTGQRQEITTAF